jgi:hypothetical protein
MVSLRRFQLRFVSSSIYSLSLFLTASFVFKSWSHKEVYLCQKTLIYVIANPFLSLISSLLACLNATTHKNAYTHSPLSFTQFIL